MTEMREVKRVVLAGAALVAGAWVYWELSGAKYRWRYNLPPGPAPSLLFGNLLQLGAKPWITIWNWAKEYPGIFTIWMGPKPAIVITDLGLLKEQFAGKTARIFAERPYNAVFQILHQGRYGVAYSNGKYWELHRGFSFKMMREFGMGKSMMESKINDAIHTMMLPYLKDEAEKAGEAGAVVDLLCEINLVAANVILSTLCGRHWKRGDAGFDRYTKALGEFIRGLMRPEAFVLNTYPVLSKVPIINSLLQIKMYEKHGKDLRAITGEEIAKTREEWLKRPEDDSCVLYRIFAEKERREKAGDKKSFKDKQINAVFFDMFGAGHDTSKNTLGFGFLYLLHHPEVEAKCQEEIARAIGREKVQFD